MHIDDIRPNPASPRGPERTDGPAPGRETRSAVDGVDPSKRSDRVEISDEGRALAAQRGEQSGEAAGEGSLSTERATEIRGRIASAFYDRQEVIDEVARRLLDGDAL